MNAEVFDGSRPTLVVFCRRPHGDRGKRRVAAAIGPDLARRLAAVLLDTALEDARDWPGPVVISPSEAGDRQWAASLPVPDAAVCPQPRGNLGRRLNAVDRALRSGGAERLIYIGSDAPLLDADYYAAARRVLDTHDVVLGPAEDGGVVLMGSRRPWPDLKTLPWGEAGLGRQLELCCARQGLTVKYLRRSYDIDYAHDLPRLYADLARDRRTARRALRDWLADHGFAIPELNRSDGTRT